MSIKTWKQKYYPVPADQVPLKQALDHSIQKWEGLHPEILQEHNLHQRKDECDDGEKRVVQGECYLDRTPVNRRERSEYVPTVFSVDSGTCALCVHHLRQGCRTCPLYAYRNNSPCGPGADSPYAIFIDTGDNIPMLTALKETKAALESGKISVCTPAQYMARIVQAARS